jgi:TetR/AcrR family acrAB operon transcriptional repressor
MDSTNEERENRILDAAADLFSHFGYDKTTVDDIARQAGVSKGAIYLHFSSKDALFEALLIREVGRYAERWIDLIDADPAGGTIARMYKNMLLALSSSPFMSAILKRDRHMFGNYLRKPNNFFRSFDNESGQSPRYEFVKLMQDAGAIRQDIDATVITHIMNMLAFGLVGMDEVVAENAVPPTEALIEGIAAIMDQALTPIDGGNSEAGKAILHQIVETTRQQFAQSKTIRSGVAR